MKLPRLLAICFLTLGTSFFLLPHANSTCINTVQAQTIAAAATPTPEGAVATVTTLETCGGDDVSYQVPITATITYDGQQFTRVYATTNSVITFGRPDNTYWQYPTTPSISVNSMDWVAYPTARPDEHFVIQSSDGGFQVDMSVRPFGAPTSVSPTNIIVTAAISTEGTVAISYVINGPEYANTRTGARLNNGTVVPLEQANITRVEEAPVLTPEPVAPTPEPTPEPSPSPLVEPTLTPSPVPVPEPSPTPTVEPSVEPSPTPTVIPEPSPLPTNTPVLPEPLPTPLPVPVEPTPIPVVPPTLEPTPMPEPVPNPAPEPTPVPQPLPPAVDIPAVPVEPTPVPVQEPAPVQPDPVPEPAPESTPVPVEPPPVEAETLEPELEPVPVEPESPAPIPEPPVVEPEPPVAIPDPEPEVVPVPVTPSPAPEPAPEPPIVKPEPPVVATVNSTPEERAAIAETLIENAQGAPVTAQAIAEAGLEYKDLPPATPVEVREDENGNEVVITAEIAAALVVLESPAELLNAILTDPSQALLALASIGADMSVEEREESEKIILASVIAGQAAVSAASVAAAYRRNP